MCIDKMSSHSNVKTNLYKYYGIISYMCPLQALDHREIRIT